jgi:ABC-type uncharacterized transport system permease subunit
MLLIQACRMIFSVLIHMTFPLIQYKMNNVTNIHKLNRVLTLHMSALQILENLATFPTSIKNITAPHHEFSTSLSM